MTRPVPRVHAVTDRDIAALPHLESTTRALALSPQLAFHARLPDADGSTLLALARKLREAAGPGSPIFVNDRVDVARIALADGVHLPGMGLPIAAARRILDPDQLLGRSVHSPDDARRAADEGADYVFLGPIWRTGSHPDREGLGIGALAGLRSIKVIAIGGVTPERSLQCRDAGAWGVAAISALWSAADPAAAAREMLLSFEGDE